MIERPRTQIRSWLVRPRPRIKSGASSSSLPSRGREDSIVRSPFSRLRVAVIAAAFRRMLAFAGVTMLVAALLSAALPQSLALGDPGGNGNGKGGNNGNGGNSGANGHDGPQGNKGKGKGLPDSDASGTPAAPDATAERTGRDYVPDELVVANLGLDAR